MRFFTWGVFRFIEENVAESLSVVLKKFEFCYEFSYQHVIYSADLYSLGGWVADHDIVSYLNNVREGSQRLNKKG